MKKQNIDLKSFIGISVFSALSVCQVSFASEYKIDSSHSNVGFIARHLVSKVNGEFKEFDGTFSFDANKPEDSKVTAKVTVASINTNEKKRDQHLLSDDFFSQKKFPTVTFVSTQVIPNGDKKYKMNGNLTMHGNTKPVTFDVEFLGETDDPWGGHRAGFSATTQINRKDFGINWNKALDKGGFVLGDEVVINLNVEALQQTAEMLKSDQKKKIN